MDLENLRALDKLKFVYDSSATDLTDPYGPNKQPREWKGLTPQSRPYQVSRSNQSANTPLPLLNLWEYPNNGNSSTSWPASDLINRLWQNLEFAEQGEVTTVKSPQVLTYLSHPHWFNIDKPVMEALFNEARKYKFSEDKGPLVYVTQLDAHRRYQQQLALNL